MADTKKEGEKAKTYFGVIPKEELPSFFERLKTALANGKKEGDKKEFEFEIRSEKEPTGLSIELATIDNAKFGEYFDVNAEHIQKSLYGVTLNFAVKEESNVQKIKEAFEMIKGMVMEMPFIKAKPGKYELHFRNNGTKIAIDFVSLEGKIIQPLLDLGIDLSQYHKFEFALKTGADLGKIYSEGGNPSDSLITEILNVLIRVKSSGENVKYLATAVSAALKDVKLNNEKLQKKLEKALGFLNLINAFIGAKIKLEYDAGVLKGEGDKEVEKLPGGAEGFKKQLSGYHEMAKTSGQQMIKPTLDGMGFTDKVQSLNLDTISITAGVPKYKNGINLVLKFPGLTSVLEQLLK
jgi:hypothetical protein